MLLLRSHHHLLLHHATRFLRRAAPRSVPLATSFRPFRMSISSDASNSSASSPAPSPPPTVVPKSKIRFCPACGSPTKLAVPDGDVKMRAVCSSCGRVHYENPKMVVGCLVEHENKVLLCMAVCPANLDLVIRSEIYTGNKIYEMDLRRTRGRRRTSQDFAE